MADYGCRASIFYKGFVRDSGELFDECVGKEPFDFVLGAGVVPVGLEKAVCEMRIGEEREFDVASAEAFGEYQSEATFKVPTFMVSNADKLPIGQYVDVRSQDGMGTAHAKVVDVKDSVAYFDLNHPLAGKDCSFWVKLVDLS